MGGMKDAAYGDQPAPYPSGPGWKERSTSRMAARSMQGTAAGLRAEVLSVILETAGGVTADEAADKLGRSVLAIRPRVTELQEQGRIVKSGRTRPNESGRAAAVWIRRPAP